MRILRPLVSIHPLVRLFIHPLGHTCNIWHVNYNLQFTYYSWKPISKRPKGRPKIRWKDDVNKDIEVKSAKLEDPCPG